MHADALPDPSGDWKLRNPITGIAGCCARAASGHAAAAPPSSVMNSRRHHSITSSARASSVGGTSRPSAFAVLRLITNSNLRRLHYGQVGWLFALENPTGVDSDLAICVREVVSIAHQATDRSKLP